MKARKKGLNLYAGVGGNRKLWTNVDVTAIEIDPNIFLEIVLSRK